MSSHLVTKLHHAALVGFDLREMEGDVAVELFEEGDPITDQDRQDRIADLVGQPETKAFAGNHAAAGKPDGMEPGPQVPVYELREIAGVEFDGLPGPWQIATREDEGGFVPVRPPESL